MKIGIRFFFFWLHLFINVKPDRILQTRRWELRKIAWKNTLNTSKRKERNVMQIKKRRIAFIDVFVPVLFLNQTIDVYILLIYKRLNRC